MYSSLEISRIIELKSRNSVFNNLHATRGWSGGAMVLGKLPVPGRPTIWIQ